MNPEILIGVELGRGVLQRLLGQGTMGAVYLAYQPLLQRQVAVKVFLSASSLEQAHHEEFLQRLVQELDQSATLTHTHILATFDYGQQDDLVYQVTPYIAGESLQQVLKRSGALPFAQIQTYLEQMASALDYAHTHGILHRDLKPENILLAPEGQLLLCDFGMAGVTTEKNFALARQAVPGMLNYMAPEYALSQTIDQRADLYSLGVVLYQMVTGTVPFKGKSLGEVAMQHVKTAPPAPTTLRMDLPQAVGQVILRALAKRPTERYTQARDLASAFRLALEAAQLLSVEAQTPNALEILTNLANGNTTKTRVPIARKNSLFDPKWQTQSSLPSVSAAEALNFRAIPPTPVLPREPEITASATEQTRTTGQDGASIPTATHVQKNTFAHIQSAQTGQILKRPGFLHLADSQANIANQPTMLDLYQTTPERAAQDPFKLAEQSTIYDPYQTTPEGFAQAPLKFSEQPASGTEELQFFSRQERLDSTGLPGIYQSFAQNDKPGSTAKVSEAARIVQMPAADQPGYFAADILPLAPEAKQNQVPKKRLMNKQLSIACTCLALLLVIVSTSIFLFTRNQSNSAAQRTSAVSNPSLLATATSSANIIFSDDLNQNTHNWPISLQGSTVCTFKSGAYHVANHNTKISASVLLPGKTFQSPFVYSLTMEQVAGDTTSPNNQFGMILDTTVQNKNGRQIDTFYAFEVLNKAGGQYQFWKYDNSNNNSSSPWTQLWNKPLGKEFLQGSGPSHVNTLKVIATGKAFTFVINGVQVTTWKDSSFSSGSIGMMVNLNGSEVAFSHLLLTYS